jgi:rhodanese-related sulfurtransferase
VAENSNEDAPTGSDDASTEAPRVEPAEAKELIEGGGVELIDVREDHEWEAGRIPGARHVAVNDLPGSAEELGREQPLLVYCRTGNRSGLAADALRSAGFDVSVLDGGITAWSEKGLELEPEDGYVAESGRAAAELQARKRQKP